ncbi:MAG TPA: hypothetical protein VFM98_21770 [Ramlibacter sp.]|uniref:hypothetical protein n=1 Tax=Ramlibacter sp. TaxID=1917967 RepID=UPI002D810859|nr:hypothetical protein [Ramlibacter sp.]HET8748238.1 hypothetical protein [Ramlibacter sp.]
MQRLTASTVWSASAILLIAGAATLSSHVIPSAPAGADVAGAPTAATPVAAAAAAATSAAEAVANSTAAATRSAADAVAAVASKSGAVPPAIRAATAFAVGSEKELRQRIKWVPVRWGGEKTKTPDEASRLLLAQAAAEHAGLDEVGLGFEDVYGVINAETSWVPRKGMGRNGVTSHGLAQFEPNTAKGYGLKNPNDPVQSVYAAARYMKDGAEWAADKIEHLPLTPEQRAEKIREGVSIYYNLSVRGRNKWDGLNTAKLPVETRRHIRNVRSGADKASDLAEEIFG